MENGQQRRSRDPIFLLTHNTLFEIFIFVQKFNFDFQRKIVKTRENAAVLDFLAVDNFDFTRKIVKKIAGGKTR